MSQNRIVRLNGLKLKPQEEQSAGLMNLLQQKAALALCVTEDQIKKITIIKKSLDARHKPELFFIYVLDLELEQNSSFMSPRQGIKSLGRGITVEIPLPEKSFSPVPGQSLSSVPPVVIGAGPAGLFAAILLAQKGYRPLLLERGRKVNQRVLDVESFWQTGKLNSESNVQFGEGGAGTFSDGKLTFRGKDALRSYLFDELVKAGAPQEIRYWHKPHIGSDILRIVVQNLRKKLQTLGGTILFDTFVEEIITENAADKIKVSGIRLKGKKEIVPVCVVLLAPGNGSRDTYRMLEQKGIALESKPFAIGLRIEHTQEMIDWAQYGVNRETLSLPAADYQLTWKDFSGGRGVYSFCMCPGGSIINASSQTGCVATNGMSDAARNSGRANSALVVTVGKKDFQEDFDERPLSGMLWQEKWEQKAYDLTGGDFALPCQTVEDYVNGFCGSSLPDAFSPQTAKIKTVDLHDTLPVEISDCIRNAMLHWDHKLPGFAKGEGVLCGIETRTSAPVRILRKENMESQNITGLYPAGEGAGYAGGIVSSAIDGMRAAGAMIEAYDLPPKEFAWAKVLDK